MARRPDASAGPAAVAVLFDPATGRLHLRLWSTPASDLDDARARAERLAAAASARAAALALPAPLSIETRVFHRCR